MDCSIEFYKAFKPIQNKLKSFRKDQITIMCLESLKRTWDINISDLPKNNFLLPWHILLILKWGIAYGANKIEGKELTKKDFFSIYNMTNDLPTHIKWLDRGDSLGLWKFMRSLLSGQRTYQEKTTLYKLCITEIILKDIGIDFDVDAALNKLVGIELEEFVDFQCLLMAMFIMKENYPRYSLNSFKSLSTKLDIRKLENFLRFISMDFQELEIFMTDHHFALKNPEMEYNLLSPLYKKPLYRINNTYIAYNKTLLNRFCQHGLYDILKLSNPESFSGAFGHGFETYLTYSLRSIDDKFYREKAIRREFNTQSSVDFLLHDDLNVLLIEAKSAEMSELTPHNPEITYLEQTFKNSLIKGYKQIILTAHDLQKQNPSLFQESDFWALLVTYKDFQMGAPEFIWVEFMKDQMKYLLPNEIFNKMPIDPMKIFIVSVDEFELLCAYSNQSNNNIFKCFEIPYNNNKDKEKSRFFFDMHFPFQNIKLHNLKHVNKKYNEIFNRILSYKK